VSNIKSLAIFGECPFNITDHHDARKFLGQFNGPTFGFWIKYISNSTARTNKYGGKTAYYNFCITGQEAVSDKWIENLLQALVNCGSTINTAVGGDVENGEKDIPLVIPKASEHPEFVCELRVSVQDIRKQFDEYDLRSWLEKKLVVGLNDDENAACVSVDAVLKTLSPA